MVRWEPESKARLAEAAMVLYGERGYDQTTVAEIAERAGLTERTFFRHFADKREVLFGGAHALQELLVDTVARAPLSSTPLGAVTLALEAAGELFNERREFSVRRQRIVEGSAELQERELIKLATLAAALADALRDRGVTDPTAALTGEVAIAIFKISFDRWVTSTESHDLAQIIRDSLKELRAVTAAS
jgi:AcrR family transcriptional regulator